MNETLLLKGRFEQRPNPARPGPPQLPKGKSVSSVHLYELIKQLSSIRDYWEKNKDCGGALVSVHYRQVVAKSNRLKILLSENGKNPTESIRGAKFVYEEDEKNNKLPKHVFTHFVSINSIEDTIALLSKLANIVDHDYSGTIDSYACEKLSSGKYDHAAKLHKALVDSYYVERFDIDRASENPSEDSIITIYKTAVDTKTLLRKFGINIVDDRIIDDTTLMLTHDESRLLYNNASYLIAMSLTDFSEINRDDISDISENFENSEDIIRKPTNEPVVGVIDTQFNEHVYFHDWVEYKNMLSPDIPITEEDFRHGTAVSYIIVDGPKGNPKLDDGCGNFRVRHFGVATQHGFSSFAILKMIRDIVASNRDIKVWNLSLGSIKEMNPNFISPEAAELDRIQNEFDVIFIVAGTNIPNGANNKEMRIGSPADSLNSIVVNSVDFHNKSASYTRHGPVLSFFHKPDMSYYGGDGKTQDEKIAVCRDETGACYVEGTSFAAPWITRKMAYLIYIMGLSKEVAKALLIDAAAGWNRNENVSDTIGYGIVPINIKDILKTPNDEIRFILMGTAEKYETYTYNLPVPVVSDSYPFFARATLAYFPECNRNQGVDYTSTELDLHFGRVNDDAKIKAINDNKQSEDGNFSLYEKDARKMYRKWDNVKHISEKISKKARPKKAYDSKLWGLSVITKERESGKKKTPLPFGVVVTLKEMKGVNRLDDFMKLCMAKGWLVSKLDIENQINVYLEGEEDIDFK